MYKTSISDGFTIMACKTHMIFFFPSYKYLFCKIKFALDTYVNIVHFQFCSTM